MFRLTFELKISGLDLISDQLMVYRLFEQHSFVINKNLVVILSDKICLMKYGLVSPYSVVDFVQH